MRPSDSLRLCAALALVCLLIALAIGFAAGARPAGPRASDQTAPVGPDWYAALPLDADRATDAFLARVPDTMRQRGEAVADSRYWALAARLLANVGVLFLLVSSGAAGRLDALAARISSRSFARTAILAAVMLTFQFIVTLPVDVIAGYWRWRHFGFSDRPFLDWLVDHSLEWTSLAGFTAVGLIAVAAVIRRAPRSWPWWAGGVYLVLALAHGIATPLAIEPMLNRYTPLPDSPLKQQVLALAHAAGVPTDDVYVLDASRQSRVLNAHVSGIGPVARISLDDSTLEHAFAPAVLAVVAHEIGHYREHDMLKAILFDSALSMVGLLIVARIAGALMASRGERWALARFGSAPSIVLLWALFSAWGFASAPVLDAFLRHQEARADSYSLEQARAPEGLAEFMIHDADTARLRPSMLDVVLFHDHPGSASRVAAAMQWRAQHPQQQGFSSGGTR